MGWVAWREDLSTLCPDCKSTLLTSLVVVDDARADDLSARREDLLEFELRQRAWQTADVEVGVLDALAAWTGVRHLHDTTRHATP